MPDVLKSVNTEKDNKSSLITALQTPPKQPIPQQQHQKQIQHSAIIQPSLQQKQPVENQKSSKVQQQQTKHGHNVTSVVNSNGSGQDVERLLGQLLEDNAQPGTQQQQQRVHTIQLTPQKQQHLKSIQLQIQTLSQRLTPGDTEMQNALKLLFAEQQKILASGKLLPPAIYHNNQLTIMNPSGLSGASAKVQQQQQQKNESIKNDISSLHHVSLGFSVESSECSSNK